MKQAVILFASCILSSQYVFSQENITVNPGTSRWGVKTSIGATKSKAVPLSNLMQLPLLDAQYTEHAYATTLIPVAPAKGLKEGDIITTKGYLRLVALENDSKKHEDGDYHIQLTLTGQSNDSCFIVEIPYADFISNNSMLKESAGGRRTFGREQLLNGKNPSIT